MAMYSNGQTRYNNLLDRFNNPNMSQEDIDMYNWGANIGNIIGNGINKKKDNLYGNSIVGGVGNDQENFNAANNIPNAIPSLDTTNNITAGSGDMKELLDLAEKAKM